MTINGNPTTITFGAVMGVSADQTVPMNFVWTNFRYSIGACNVMPGTASIAVGDELGSQFTLIKMVSGGSGNVDDGPAAPNETFTGHGTLKFRLAADPAP